MAKIRSSSSTFVSSDSLDCVVELPSHETGDLLLILVAKDDATGGAFTTPAGWTKGGENNNGASGGNTVRGAWYYLVAASSAETDPTITSTDADTWSAVAVSIRGVNASPIDTSNGNGITDSTGNPYPAASVTTGFNDSLVFYAICSDGGVSPVAAPGFNTVAIADSGSDACALAFKVQRTAGASGTCDFYASGTADESVLFTIAIRDGSSGTILPGYTNTDVATIVQPLKGANLTFTGDALDANSNNFTQLAGTWAAVSTAYQVDSSPLTFTDVTTAANNATDADVVPFPATEATGDYFAISYSSQFRAIRFDRAGCTAGVAGVCAREYLSTGGTVWKNLPDFFDSATSFTAAVADHNICGWTIPQDWTSESLNGVSGYWIRFRITTIYTTNPTISQVFISTSLALSHDTLTGRSDAGVIPRIDATNVTPGFSGNLMCGGAYAMNSVVNLSTAKLMGTFLLDSPADSLDVGKRTDGGIAVGLIDSTDKVKAWCVASRDSLDFASDKRGNFVIQVNQSTDTSLLSASPTMSDIKRILLMANNRSGACQLSFNPLINIGTLKLSGGGSSSPIDYDELLEVANSYPCPLIDRLTNVAYCPIQIGGVEAVNFQASGFTLTFPQQATAANKKASFHVDNNVVGFIFDARAGDVCKITNAKITSLSPYLFSFEATASSSAAYDFNGLVVEGATVTLRAVYTFSGITFTNCPSFTQNGAAIDLCTLSGTKITSNDPGDISNCSFTSSGTGHAIEATTPGTYSFDGNTFSGYGANTTTDASFYNNSGGLVTLNLQNYDDETPTVRNGAGATTTIVPKPNEISITNIIAGSRLQIYNVTTATEISNSIIGGTSASTTYQEGVEFTSGDTVRVRLAKQSGATAYLPYEIIVLAGATGWSVLASQGLDEVYNDNAIDGSAVTEFSADGVNVEVDVTDTDNVTTWGRLYAWYIYALMDSSGIDVFFNGIEAQDSSNYVVNGDIVDIAFDNKKTDLLTITGGFGKKEGGAVGLVSTTTTGSIYFDSGRAYTAANATAPTVVQIRQEMDTNSTQFAAIKAKTDNLPSDPADQSLLMAEHATTQAAIAAIPSAPTAAAIRAEIDANSTQLAAIVADTNELQTNQGNWLTATGFATPANVTNAQTAIVAEVNANETKIDLLETKAQADARQALLIAEHDSTQSAIAALPAAPSAAAIRAEMDSNSTKLASIDADTSRVDALIENSSGDRFTAKALETAGGGGVTAADIADAVLDEALSGHTTAGSLGKALADIEADTNELQGNQGDWLTATGFATPTNVTNAQTAIVAEINANEAKIDLLETKAQADVRQLALIAEHDATQADLAATESVILAEIAAIPAGLTATQVWSHVIATGYPAERILRVCASVLAGKTSGGPGSTVFRDILDAGNQLTTVSDANGNRTTVTIAP